MNCSTCIYGTIDKEQIEIHGEDTFVCRYVDKFIYEDIEDTGCKKYLDYGIVTSLDEIIRKIAGI